MKVSGTKLASAVAMYLILLPAAAAALSPSPLAASTGTAYPNTSWALGLVVPEGASLQGGVVRWGSVTNVTARVTLPNMTSPDGIVYAVLSVMASDGSVLQCAAGAAPGRSGWLVYSWFVQGIGSGPLTYRWILNSSGPTMGPMGNISMSIFSASGRWSVRVEELGSGSSVEEQFPAGTAPSLKTGDQEVFALESYTRTGSTFRNMGNLTLNALLLDGRRVTGGFYTYGQWDPLHSPIFVVGSSGSSPPSFIYLGRGEAGSLFWSYSGVWVPQGNPLGGTGVIMVAALLTAAGLVTGAILWMTRRPAGRAPQAVGSFLNT